MNRVPNMITPAKLLRSFSFAIAAIDITLPFTTGHTHAYIDTLCIYLYMIMRVTFFLDMTAKIVSQLPFLSLNLRGLKEIGHPILEETRPILSQRCGHIDREDKSHKIKLDH